MRVAALLAAAMLALPADAQDAMPEVAFDPAPLAACWKEQARAVGCAGAGASPCMQATPFGFSTRGMTACLAAELDWWEALMAKFLDELRAAEAGFDAEPPEPGMPAPPPSGLEALERTQTLWAEWVVARCDYEVIEFLSGTLRGPVWLGCRTELTLRQVDFLAGRLRTHANR